LVSEGSDFDGEGFDFRLEDSDLFGGIVGVSLTGVDGGGEGFDGFFAFNDSGGLEGVIFVLLHN